MAKATAIVTAPAVTLELTASEAATLLQVLNMTTFYWDSDVPEDAQAREDGHKVWDALSQVVPEPDVWAGWVDGANRKSTRSLTYGS